MAYLGIMGRALVRDDYDTAYLDMNNSIIRKATPDDVPALVSLLQGCAAAMSELGMSHWLGVYDETSVTQNLNSKTVFVLESDKRLIGCIALGKEAAEYYQDCWPDAPAADFYITQLAVSPSKQGAGYGKQLVQHCLNQVGQQSLLLDAVDHYPALLAFYESLGFEIIATGIGLGDKRHLFRFKH